MKKIYISLILLIFILIGYFEINNANVVAKEKILKVDYSAWEYEGKTNCLVDRENKPFEKEYVKYEHDSSGMCKKYTRDIIK